MTRFRRTAIWSVSARWASATPPRQRQSRPHCSAAVARAGRAAAPVRPRRIGAKARRHRPGARASRRPCCMIRSPSPRRWAAANLPPFSAPTLAARRGRIPVLLDGFVCTAAVAPLARLRADTLAHAMAGHVSAEAGHRMLLDELGLEDQHHRETANNNVVGVDGILVCERSIMLLDFAGSAFAVVPDIGIGHRKLR